MGNPYVCLHYLEDEVFQCWSILDSYNYCCIKILYGSYKFLWPNASSCLCNHYLWKGLLCMLWLMAVLYHFVLLIQRITCPWAFRFHLYESTTTDTLIVEWGSIYQPKLWIFMCYWMTYCCLVLQMITKNFEDYPEHRLKFFSLLRAIATHCFAALIQLSSQVCS